MIFCVAFSICPIFPSGDIIRYVFLLFVIINNCINCGGVKTMQKGKLGISLAAIAVLAFALMCFGSFELLLLALVGYAVIVEKNDWLTRQTLQALYLRLTYVIATAVFSWLFGFPSRISRRHGRFHRAFRYFYDPGSVPVGRGHLRRTARDQGAGRKYPADQRPGRSDDGHLQAQAAEPGSCSVRL